MSVSAKYRQPTRAGCVFTFVSVKLIATGGEALLFSENVAPPGP